VPVNFPVSVRVAVEIPMALNGLIAKARGGSLIDGITSTISALKK